MKEDFLHFIWKYQYFRKHELRSENGEEIAIISPGTYNTNAGPDFFNSKIKINDVLWGGNIEIHINSSDWKAHKHHQDKAYDNVVLHVVWNNDHNIKRTDGTELPVLVLKERVDDSLVNKYFDFFNSKDSLPCAFGFSKVDEVIKISMLDKALVTRLERKAETVRELYLRNNMDWEETCWQTLCKCFGFKLNQEPFNQLAFALPYKIIRKYSNDLQQLEALLFGVAGFLKRDHRNEYANVLQKEYNFLSHKHDLKGKEVAPEMWKFHRLRPSNSPALRIAQLAALLYKKENLFSWIINFQKENVKELISCEPSKFWRNHYFFDDEVESRSKGKLGTESAELLIINAIVPIIACYSREKGFTELMDVAITLLEKLTAENNRITRFWKEKGLNLRNASETQAAIELYNQYCIKKLCLSCNIGVNLIRNN